MLFFRELKKVICSFSFLILIIGMIAMAASQDIFDFSDRKMEMPQPGQDYGMQTKEIPEIIMPAALDSLYHEFCADNYTAYPIGFYKNVKLNDSKQQQMAEILSALTGTPVKELMKADSRTEEKGKSITFDNGTGITAQGNGDFTVEMPDESSDGQAALSITLQENISYEEFKGYMAKADELIGGGSSYSQAYLIRFGRVPITYEEAIEQYSLWKNEDHFTGAFARMFSDYMGVGVLSVLPVFLGVALCLKDKRANVNGLIYTRKVSSIHIIITRYLGILAAVMIPTIILSYISNASVWNMFDGMAIDYLAPLKYDLGWLLPSVMVSAAVGMFLTELTGTPIAIAVQGLWWFLDMNLGISEIYGGYSLFRLTPRHNSLGNTQVYMDGFERLAANRLLFAGIALLLIAATVVIYEQKRRGKINGYGKIKKFFADLADRKNKSAA